MLFKEYYNKTVVTEGSTASPLTKKLLIRIAKSLAWTITVGENAAVVCISSR